MSRFHALRDAREGGFAVTGVAAVAAAVVVVLAVTAVAFSLTRKDEVSKAPVRENAVEQRDATARAETMSSVKNAATAMESWAVDNGGTYAGACGGKGSTTCPAFDRSAKGGPGNRLIESGLQLPPGVSVTVIRADSTGYCLRAAHEDLRPGNEVYYTSELGTPSNEPCI